MSLEKKFQIPSGTSIHVINAPSGFKMNAPKSKGTNAEAFLLFARNLAELKSLGKSVFNAAKEDKLAWIAYPKAGQLDTDLNRDKLWKLLQPYGIRPVRQVSIDDVWSALRFRPE